MEPAYRRSTNPQDPGPFEGLQIVWKDGLPKDRAEDSTIESTLVASQLTSHYSSIKRLLDGDDDAAQEEMDRIKQEQMDQTFNPVLVGAVAQGGAPPANQQPQGATDNIQQSAQLVAQLRGAQGGGTNQPEEGGPKR